MRKRYLVTTLEGMFIAAIFADCYLPVEPVKKGPDPKIGNFYIGSMVVGSVNLKFTKVVDTGGRTADTVQQLEAQAQFASERLMNAYRVQAA